MAEYLQRRDATPRFDAPAELEIGETKTSQPPAIAREPLNVWAVVRRHVLLITASAILAGVATMLVTMRIAPTYVSSATIRIDQKSSQLPALDALGLWSGNALATEVGILQSRALAEEVVDSLGLQLVVSHPLTVRRSSIFSRIGVDRAAPAGEYRLVPHGKRAFTLVDQDGVLPPRTVQLGEQVQAAGMSFELAPSAGDAGEIDFSVIPFQNAVQRLQHVLDVSRRDKEGDLVDVSYRGTDPVLASSIVNLLASRFVSGRQEERHAEARGMVGFLGDQIQRVSDQLASSEQALRDFREREHVISLDEEASTGVTRQAELRAQRNTLDAERTALERLLRAAQRAGAGTGGSQYRDLLAFPTIVQSGAAAALLGPLTVAEGQRTDLLGRRTAEDPDVQVLNARIAQLHGQIESLVSTYLQGLTNQVAALDAIIARSDARLSAIPRKEIELAELQRNATSSATIYSMLQGRLQEAQIAEAASDPSIRLVDPAVVPIKPVAPKPLLNLAFALIAGALVGVAGAVGRELSDRSLHTRRELLAASGVPVLGIVPHMMPSRRLLRLRGGRMEREDARRTTVQAFSWLATNLAFLRPGAPMRTMVVTSALPGDGKTTVATQLSRALADHGRRVLLVDADLRGGRVATALGLHSGPGLHEVLAGRIAPDAAVQRASARDDGDLSVITAGSPPKQPTPLLASERVRELLDWAKANYDVTIIDSCPLNVAADAALVASRSDGTIIVARAGATERGAIGLAMDQLSMAHAPIAGAVLNDVDLRRDSTYDSAYRYYGRYGVARA